MRAAMLAVTVLLAAAPGAGAQEHHDVGPVEVTIGFADFEPPAVDVLAGDEVRWRNASVRRHDVAAVDGAFASGVLGPGAAFARAFAAAGAVAYYCSIHPFMRGTVGVHELLLDAPREPGVPGRPFPLHGRSALPPGAPVTIEADEGTGFAPAARTTVRDDGTFTADLRPRAGGQLRAVSGASASPSVTLLVLDRSVAATASRARRGVARVRAVVSPPAHGATVVLQLRLRERFGWWPVKRARLDHKGRASFRVRPPRRVRARVVLTLADGATPLAVSPTLRIGG